MAYIRTHETTERRKRKVVKTYAFATVIVKDREIIGESTNRVPETHDPIAHREILAIVRQRIRTLTADELAIANGGQKPTGTTSIVS
jgi:tRNA(Arg) A34 adenosine deaminase TadA